MSMTIQEAIKRITDHMEVHHIGDPPHIKIGSALLMAIAALMEKAEREDPPPLTLAELLEIPEGDPVLVEYKEGAKYFWTSDWAAITKGSKPSYVNIWWFGNECEETASHDNYGKTWIAYRHKPKEVTK